MNAKKTSQKQLLQEDKAICLFDKDILKSCSNVISNILSIKAFMTGS